MSTVAGEDGKGFEVCIGFFFLFNFLGFIFFGFFWFGKVESGSGGL